jgi:3-oxoacyl-[acyl-carrier protein] reductase
VRSIASREALRIMAAHDIKGLHHQHVASTAVQSGEGPVHYVTSKTALVGMTRAIAREVASRGIRINAVAPGPTDTPMMRSIPEERNHEPRKSDSGSVASRTPRTCAAAAALPAGDESLAER